MQDLTELLNLILDQTTFGSHSDASMSPEQLRDIMERRGWHDEEIISARKAQPDIPDALFSQLRNHLRSLLQEYIDPETDHIGHAFPIDSPRMYPIDCHHGERIETFQPNGLVSLACVSALEDFAKGLVKGAAVIGAERVVYLLSGWLQGGPAEYRISALLNGLPVREPLAPADGVRIEPLPLSTDELALNLPRRTGMSAADYLGRTIVSIDTAAKPALFSPNASPPARHVQANLVGDVDIDTVCQALSLESDNFLDVAFCWNDYQELASFSLSDKSSTWSTGNKRVRSHSGLKSMSTEFSTGVTKLEFKGAQRMLDLSEAQLTGTLAALKVLKDSHKTRIAVSRWVKSKDSSEHLVDRFIDLRIALESLYLRNIGNEKYRGEMRFRLSLTGAWHLGSDRKERKKVRKNLLEAYDAASKAVHSGDLENSKYPLPLSTAQDLCRRGILKLLKEGSPSDWGDLILGIENK